MDPRGVRGRDFEPRDMCWTCLKARVVCICDRINEIDNRTGVTIFQHPRERRHPLGTARIARLALRRSRLVVAWGKGPGSITQQFPLDAGTAVLYPSPGARDLETLSPDDHPRHLIVVDGTWHTAHCLRRENAWLDALPHVRLTPEAPSNYRVRREPKAEYISTVESIVAALRILEPATSGLDTLLDVFATMVDDQIRYLQSDAPRRFTRGEEGRT